MPLPKEYEPAPESWMTTVNPRFTIYEVIRQIYSSTDFAEIKFKARVAMHMAKRMNQKLMEYNDKWNSEEWGEKTAEMNVTIGRLIPDREDKK